MRPYQRIVTAIILISSFAITGRAQIEKKSFLISLGVYSGYGYPVGLQERTNSGISTASLSIEYLISKLFSVGLYGTYTYSFYKDPFYYYKDVWEGADIGAKGTFRFTSLFPKPERFDAYLSAFAGYTTRSLEYDKSNIYRGSLDYTVHKISVGGLLGCRYFVSKRIGLYVELGMARTLFQGGGVTLKLNSKK